MACRSALAARFPAALGGLGGQLSGPSGPLALLVGLSRLVPHLVPRLRLLRIHRRHRTVGLGAEGLASVSACPDGEADA